MTDLILYHLAALGVLSLAAIASTAFIRSQPVVAPPPLWAVVAIVGGFAAGAALFIFNAPRSIEPGLMAFDALVLFGIVLITCSGYFGRQNG